MSICMAPRWCPQMAVPLGWARLGGCSSWLGVPGWYGVPWVCLVGYDS